ncbi:GFA family protein [Thalassotalea sp. M1531]|uniref:GFA family protein n=2 Tax=Thalassotalea algicola TaxID=2716224 RepID=A0A7Y0Q5E0_9GAMM|nr:GFA family protein [Thalassotalea algicola]
MNITGGCHCGEIQYQAEVDSDKVMICHCTDCQRLSGSAFRTVVVSKLDGLEITRGQVKEYVKTADSGNQRAQGFCGNCGSAIYATSVEAGPKVYGIRLGTVDQQSNLPPKAQIWCRSKLSWIPSIKAIKAFTTIP